jgi:hypothetical protein
MKRPSQRQPNMAFQRSGWIVAILTTRSGKPVFPIYERDTFQSPLNARPLGGWGNLVGWQIVING